MIDMEIFEGERIDDLQCILFKIKMVFVLV